MLKDRSGVSWTLVVKGDMICRHCFEKIQVGSKAYFCPKDKKMSCTKCKDLDNNYHDHSTMYLSKEGDKHTHYFVTLIKKKEKKEDV